jgi:hypothetical protein
MAATAGLAGGALATWTVLAAGGWTTAEAAFSSGLVFSAFGQAWEAPSDKTMNNANAVTAVPVRRNIRRPYPTPRNRMNFDRSTMAEP